MQLSPRAAGATLGTLGVSPVDHEGTGVLAGAHTGRAPDVYVGGNPGELSVGVRGDLG